MTVKEAKQILNKIIQDPSLADQFTEEEIEKLEQLVKNKKS